MENLLDIMKCDICLTKFDLKDHVPYVLSCGHHICRKSINKLFSQDLKSIQCPQCKQPCAYEASDRIPKNFMLVNMLESIYGEVKHASVGEAEGCLGAVDGLIKEVEKENQAIDEYVAGIVSRQREFKKMNRDIILRLSGYKHLKLKEL